MGKTLNILLIAPNQRNLNSIPEIRMLSSIHKVQVLSGNVTSQDVFQAARASHVDVIHFATHGGPDGVTLSSVEYSESGIANKIVNTLSPEDIVQIAKLSKAKLLFFNACNTGKLASYATRRGIEYAISANEEVTEEDAWKFPLTFYEFIGTQPEHNGDINFALTFDRAEGGDGLYSFSINLTEYLARPSEIDIEKLNVRIDSLTHEMELLRMNLTSTRSVLLRLLGGSFVVTMVSVLLLVLKTLGVL